MKKIGLFGGTFNPIHIGHMELAEGAIKSFNLDKVYFIPTGESYHKDIDYIPSIEDRMKMLEIAIGDNAKFYISDCDIKRKGPTYTVDTIKDMQELESNACFYWIMGSDSFLSILNWKDLMKVTQSLYFLVALRHGNSRAAVEKLLEKAPEYLKKRVIIFEWPIVDISSKEIRTDIEKKKYLPKGVYDYIKQKGLYEYASK